MELEELKKEVAIWDKWTFNWINREIVCYTCNVILDDDTKFYKAKEWIDNVSLHNFFQMILDKKTRENYCNKRP